MLPYRKFCSSQHLVSICYVFTLSCKWITFLNVTEWCVHQVHFISGMWTCRNRWFSLLQPQKAPTAPVICLLVFSRVSNFEVIGTLVHAWSGDWSPKVKASQWARRLCCVRDSATMCCDGLTSEYLRYTGKWGVLPSFHSLCKCSHILGKTFHVFINICFWCDRWNTVQTFAFRLTFMKSNGHSWLITLNLISKW